MDYRQEAQKWAAKAYEILMAEELRRQDEIKREKELANNPETFIDKANKGEVDSILKLKEFAKEGNKKANYALEKLYWDGNKEHAVGTVVIREGVTSLDNREFIYCKDLEKVILPESLVSIADGYYDSYHNYYIGSFSRCSRLEDIVFPKILTSIGDGAFYGCTNLREIKFPAGLISTSIGESAFDSCTSLREIKFPAGLISIGRSAFFGCTALEKIVLPEGVTSIDAFAFRGCESLKKINLPEGLTKIGAQAFFGCSSLTEINLPESLTEISNWVFAHCRELKKITYSRKIESRLKEEEFFGDRWNRPNELQEIKF